MDSIKEIVMASDVLSQDQKVAWLKERDELDRKLKENSWINRQKLQQLAKEMK